MAAYLIKEGYEIEQINEAAHQWATFIRPDYYTRIAIEEADIDSEQYGFSSDPSCFSERCEQPFYIYDSEKHLGGCGGMDELIISDD